MYEALNVLRVEYIWFTFKKNTFIKLYYSRFYSADVCVYICMCVYMHVCIYVCVYMYMYMYICTCVCTCVYIYICTCIYVYMYMYICIYVHVYMYICVYTHTHTHTHACSHDVILKFVLLSPGEQWDLPLASGGAALTCMVFRPGEERCVVQQGQCNRGAKIKGRKCEMCQLLFINQYH